MIEFDLLPLWAILIATIVILMVTFEAARYFGKRMDSDHPERTETLEGAALGLLALMIGFTFAMALSRFDGRRDGVLAEANAIGTTALRARMLAEPYRTDSLGLLNDYAQLRLTLTRLDEQSAARTLSTMIEQSNVIQEKLWTTAMAASAKDPSMVPVGLYIQSLNDMIDNQAKRLAAVRARLPSVVLFGLYGVATIAFALVGYGRGVRSEHTRMAAFAMVLLLSSVLLLIQDLDRPSGGFITVSQQPMIDTAASVATYLK